MYLVPLNFTTQMFLHYILHVFIRKYYLEAHHLVIETSLVSDSELIYICLFYVDPGRKKTSVNK